MLWHAPELPKINPGNSGCFDFRATILCPRLLRYTYVMYPTNQSFLELFEVHHQPYKGYNSLKRHRIVKLPGVAVACWPGQAELPSTS
jgi:hypothetical protein